MTQKKLDIPVSGLHLSAVLHLPETPNPPVIVGSHGLLSTKESGKQLTLAKRCNALGIAYLRLDHRGCGESQGHFLDTTLTTRVEDLLAAAGVLKGFGLTKNGLALFGSSMGGATCLAAWNPLLAEGFPLKAMVSLAAPVAGIGMTEAAIAAQEELHDVPLSYYQKNMGFDLTEELSDIHHILVVHGDNDEIVPIHNAHNIMELAQGPKELIVNEGGDHRMSDPAHQARFFTRATAWLQRALLGE
ncbi:alpha/beta hydrolase [Desulfoluna sp.]|uniref:alpha/beta hydrolase n=1 Tax=Desulfoluna sp. TaxID=2045199 RepID=UPI00260F1840|nr:alpha/beta hydrolase [Desulfoluna sp.]